MNIPFRRLAAMALPLALGNLTMAVQELAVRLALGRAGVAALAASLPASMLALLFTGVLVNTVGQATPMIAAAHGAGDEERARRIFVHAAMLAAAAVPLCLFAVPAGLAVLKFAGHEPAVLRDECVYFCFSAAGGLFTVLSTALAAWHCGHGRTRFPCVASVAGCTLAAASAATLVLGCNLGIAGAGIGKLAGAVLQSAILFAGVRRLFAPPRNWRIDLPLAGKILRQGLPFGLSSVVGSGTFTVFVFCLGRYGAGPLATGNLCLSLNNFYMTAQTAIEAAVAIAAGLCIGAGDRAGVRRVFRHGVALSLLALAVCYAPVLALAPQLAGLFLLGADQDAAARMQTFLLALLAGGAFAAFKHCATGILRGLGRTGSIFAAHCAVSAGVWLPAMFLLLRFCRNPLWMWSSFSACLALHAIVLLAIVRRKPMRTARNCSGIDPKPSPAGEAVPLPHYAKDSKARTRTMSVRSAFAQRDPFEPD